MRPDRRSKQAAKLENMGEANRSQTRDSVNFSRPISPPTSPPISPSNVPSIAHAAAVRAPTIANRDADSIQNAVQGATNRSVKKKKAKAKGNAEGSHFHTDASDDRLAVASSSAALQRERPSRQLPPSMTLQNREGKEAQINQSKKIRSIPATDDGLRYSHWSDPETQSERGSSDRPRTYNTRAAGLLAKQPSLVREDRAAEEREERTILRRLNRESTQNSGHVTGHSPTSTQASEIYQQHDRSTSELMAPSISTTGTSNISAKISTANRGQVPNDKDAARQQPLSPARAAHFSTQLVIQTPEIMKHQPPARSVSPAKSALKHSPSSRGPSPMGALPGSWNGRNGRAASEASDTTSAVSDDGTRIGSKKKIVKVSFDDDSVVVGRAASPPTSPDSPILMSPQDKRAVGGWPVANRNEREDLPASNPNISSVMQPTPTLPSFGSIGGKHNSSPAQYIRPKTVQDKSESMPTRIESSADQIIGRIFAQDLERKGHGSTISTPLTDKNSPPSEVTSAKGIDYHSDSEDDIGASESSSVPDRPLILDTASSEASDKRIPGIISNRSVPSIAILPATPGVEDRNEVQNGWLSMPGGFPPSTDSLHDDQTSATTLVENHHPTPAQVGIAEPEPNTIAFKNEAGVSAVGHVAKVLRTQIHSQAADDSEDTDSSIYSDAAEDLSDFEGDGFGSINAIVESPARPEASVLMSISTPGTGAESSDQRSPNLNQTRPGLLRRNESELSEPGSEEGWDRAQEYWSGLSQVRKEQLERAASPGTLGGSLKQTKPAVAATRSGSKKKISLGKPAQSPIQEHPPLPPWPDKQYRKEMGKLSPSKGSAMKRNSQSEGSQGVVTLARDSVQSPDVPQPRAALRRKTRPTSAATMEDYNIPKTGTAINHNRAASAEPTPRYLTTIPTSPSGDNSAFPKLRRIKSNGSDSSSSFKKSRPRATDNDRYTMKRSMRGGSTDDRPLSMQGNRNSSLNGRSLSPSGPNARRPFSSAGPSMRTSLRGSIEADVESRTKSPSRFGFGKAVKSKSKKDRNSKLSSRFADSSDEEDNHRVQSSRFLDSSDDEDMTPVRGIPRRIDEGDSTELEDSPVEHSPPSKSKPKNSPAGPPIIEGITQVGPVSSPYNPISGALAAKTGSQARIWAEKEKKKRSFFGSLGAKKNSESRVQKTDLDSPARRDSRPNAERLLSSGTIGDASPAAAPTLPRSPKLQRRNTPKRFASDSWPLPGMPPKMPGADDRPNTSDGNGLGVAIGSGGFGNGNGTARPDLGERRSTLPGEAPPAAPAGPGPGPKGIQGPATGDKVIKKKRFPMLRKALRLHD
jgi:serine/arginine repetitive matrix protein 2